MEHPLSQIEVDFNSMDDDGTVAASRRFVDVEWYALEPGARVIAVDADGNFCYAEIVKVDGLAIDLKPEWDSWRAGQSIDLAYSYAHEETRELTRAAR